jgi:hypothetical protein
MSLPANPIPARLDFSVVRGNTFSWSITVSTSSGTVDISAFSVIAQIRRRGELVDAFAIDDSEAEDGQIVLSLTAAQSAALQSGDTWDLLLTSPSYAGTLVTGQLIITPRVSEP